MLSSTTGRVLALYGHCVRSQRRVQGGGVRRSFAFEHQVAHFADLKRCFISFVPQRLAPFIVLVGRRRKFEDVENEAMIDRLRLGHKRSKVVTEFEEHLKTLDDHCLCMDIVGRSGYKSKNNREGRGVDYVLGLTLYSH